MVDGEEEEVEHESVTYEKQPGSGLILKTPQNKKGKNGFSSSLSLLYSVENFGC